MTTLFFAVLLGLAFFGGIAFAIRPLFQRPATMPHSVPGGQLTAALTGLLIGLGTIAMVALLAFSAP